MTLQWDLFSSKQFGDDFQNSASYLTKDLYRFVIISLCFVRVHRKRIVFNSLLESDRLLLDSKVNNYPNLPVT